MFRSKFTFYLEGRREILFKALDLDALEQICLDIYRLMIAPNFFIVVEHLMHVDVTSSRLILPAHRDKIMPSCHHNSCMKTPPSFHLNSFCQMFSQSHWKWLQPFQEINLEMIKFDFTIDKQGFTGVMDSSFK